MINTNLPQILTPEEIAEYLRVTADEVLQEFETGNLRGFKVGLEWRSTDVDLMEYVGVDKQKMKAHINQMPTKLDTEVITEFAEIGPFHFGWPQYGGGVRREHYEIGYETTRRIKGRQFTFRIGFGEREAAGRLRPRVVVWLGNRPLVEFAGGNDYETDYLLASVIKLKSGRQLWPNEETPPEYQGFQVARYDSIVQGPYASTNMAIIVHKDDLESMLRHAIIRAQWKDII